VTVPARRCLSFAVLAMLVSGLLGITCSPDHFQSPPGFPGAVENIDHANPESYYATWNGDVSLPDSPAESVSAEEWSRLITSARNSGLLAMPVEDRRVLLQGAIKAYLVSVTSTRRVIDAGARGKSDVVEIYGLEDGLYTALSAREASDSGIATQWADGAVIDTGTHLTRMFVNSFSNGASAEVWTLGQNGQWSCRLNRDASAGLWLQQREYYQILAGTVILGTPKRVEMFSGREAVLFENATLAGTRRAWVDVKTLWPIGFALPAEHRAGTQSTPARTVMITGINVVPTLDKPSEHCRTHTLE